MQGIQTECFSTDWRTNVHCVVSGKANQTLYTTNTLVFMKELSDGGVAAGLTNLGSFGPPTLVNFTTMQVCEHLACYSMRLWRIGSTKIGPK